MLRRQLNADLDPSAEPKATNLRKKLAAENSFEAVAREWYTKQLHTWVPHNADIDAVHDPVSDDQSVIAVFSKRRGDLWTKYSR